MFLFEFLLSHLERSLPSHVQGKKIIYIAASSFNMSLKKKKQLFFMTKRTPKNIQENSQRNNKKLTKR